MSNIFEAVNENAHAEWLLERAKILVEIEAKLPRHEWNESNFPMYLHILRPRDYGQDDTFDNHKLLDAITKQQEPLQSKVNAMADKMDALATAIAKLSEAIEKQASTA